MATSKPVDQLPEALRRGIELCRQGEWNDGLFFLGKIAQAGRTDVPGIYYSYLGYGIARCQKRTEEGLKLCRHAVKLQFYEPDNYVNLARTALLANERGEAVQAVRKGLKVDRNNLELQALFRELGIRQSPVLPFLARSNPLNLVLGRIRSRLFGQRAGA
jgi:tetratricopeptide (TPR) repeat protein